MNYLAPDTNTLTELIPLILDPFHHNVDKLGVKGGHWERDFGRGKLLRPATVVFGGRMSTEFGGEQIDIEAPQAQVADDYLLKVSCVPELDRLEVVEQEVRVSNFLSPKTPISL